MKEFRDRSLWGSVGAKIDTPASVVPHVDRLQSPHLDVVDLVDDERAGPRQDWASGRMSPREDRRLACVGDPAGDRDRLPCPLGGFETPNDVRFVDELAKNVSGKIRTRELRDQFGCA